MTGSRYPMLRKRRRARRGRLGSLIGNPRVRIGAVLLLSAGVIGGGVVLARRPAPVDARTALLAAADAFDEGDYGAARVYAGQAAKAAPQWPATHVLLARAYLEQGEGLAAEGEIDRAAATGIPRARLHQLAAHARLLQWDLGGAIEQARQAAPRYAGYAGRIEAQAMGWQGHRTAAADRLQHLAAERPDDARIWTDLAAARLSLGQIGEASDAAARAASLAPRDPAALTIEGDLVRLRYGLVAALPWYRTAIRRDATYYPALIRYAATLGDLGRGAPMLAATRAALAARPDDPQALYLQAVLAARAGDDDLATDLFNRGGYAAPDIAGALLLGGALDYGAGRFEQAAQKWGGLSAWRPANSGVRRLYVAALLRAGNVEEAIAALRPVAGRRDLDGYTLTLLARAAEAAGDRVAAAAYLDRAGRDGAGETSPGGDIARQRSDAASWPGMPGAQIGYGDALIAAGRPQDASAPYAHAADLRFDEPAAQRLVDALGRSGRRRDAAATLALYLEQNPHSVAARRILARWQIESSRWNAAIETLEHLRSVVGNRDAGLLADLAIAYAGADDGIVARRYGAAAYALAPLSPAAADAYGIALASAGQRDGARQLLDKAALLAPRDAGIAAHRRSVG